jgi:hypothetical protein
LISNEDHDDRSVDVLVRQRVQKDLSENNTKSVIEFAASSYAILENEQVCKIMIERYGNLENEISFRYSFNYYAF